MHMWHYSAKLFMPLKTLLSVPSSQAATAALSEWTPRKHFRLQNVMARSGLYVFCIVIVLSLEIKRTN